MKQIWTLFMRVIKQGKPMEIGGYNTLEKAKRAMEHHAAVAHEDGVLAEFWIEAEYIPKGTK